VLAMALASTTPMTASAAPCVRALDPSICTLSSSLADLDRCERSASEARTLVPAPSLTLATLGTRIATSERQRPWRAPSATNVRGLSASVTGEYFFVADFLRAVLQGDVLALRDRVEVGAR
jgi:hypothetical protein